LKENSYKKFKLSYVFQFAWIDIKNFEINLANTDWPTIFFAYVLIRVFQIYFKNRINMSQ